MGGVIRTSTWHYAVGQDYEGSIEEEELRALFRSGAVEGETFLWKPGMDGWVQAKDVGEFAGVFVKPPPLCDFTEGM
ncbi:DUF4339 domain-containing protein [Rhizobium jaguaris]|uniref:DUF4339 domain-containing protein n=1 Tax=Rhizobium jaguaris TaxID=1312183 RepID=A0A387FMW3_9HYPH|nr:DUF4339 domain-containing protein [Rhizobium jaguaris]